MGASASIPEAASSDELLRGQDAKTTQVIIAALGEDASFQALGKFEAEAIVARDREDAEKLQTGIQVSIDAGVLPPLETPPEYVEIDVVGKTPDQVCDVIVEHVGDAAQSGCVIVLCGLSGTGKGTTVSNLKARLPATVTWSNGNIFRALTLLAVKWCEQNGLEAFDADQALTAENLASFMTMLKFDKYEGGWDTRIDGLGVTALISEVQNTVLKGPSVSQHIPTVAQQTQGHVVNFAAEATRRMGADGLNVLLEGREATVNYVPTPFRYTLCMSDTTLLGQRRAAQRLAAKALEKIGAEPATNDAVAQAVQQALSEFASEIQQ